MFSDKYYVLDGGLASTLQSNGYKVDGDPLWSARLLATNPDAIRKVHIEFLEAGAEVLVSSSYQASEDGFAQHLQDRSADLHYLMNLPGKLVREAVEEYEKRGKRGQVEVIAGSIGPYGACQADGSEYTGTYVKNKSQDELIAWHRRRIHAQQNSGIDVLALETLPALSEALALIALLREYPCMKYWLCFTCKDGEHTCYGDSFKEAVKACYEAGRNQLQGIGINCTPPHLITSLLKQANLTLPPPQVLPRVVYPNSGEEWVPGKGWKTREGEGGGCSYLKDLEEWCKLGARVIGGCCRVGPKGIGKICEVVKDLRV